MTTFRSRQSLVHLSLRAVLPALAVAWLLAGQGHPAEATKADMRRPGEALVRPMDLAVGEQAAIRSRAGTVARALGISGAAGSPTRRYEALDHAVIDEVAIERPDGGRLAVLRFEADRGSLRSFVRLGWSRDDDATRVSLATAPTAAARFSAAAGMAAATAPPEAAWDAAMRAWQVTWPRVLDGLPAPGEGLTVWVYPGGRLAALRRIETPAASAPLLRVTPEQAQAAATAWATAAGIPPGILDPDGAPALAWVPPNDFASTGGADVTEARLHLAYLAQFTIHLPNGDVHEMLVFVDAGSGTVIGGSETA
ncbi:MAG: hypothetical protein ACHQ15_03075 [Candidatus Limnocylindrales bacterium]